MLIDEHLNIPNLDAMEDGDLRELSDIFTALSRYCKLKSDAQHARRVGGIVAALKLEKECDEIYRKRLPVWARW